MYHGVFLFSCLAFVSIALSGGRAVEFPPKIYGVNLGSWLLVEPWMLPEEWVAMGGEKCSDCSQCIASEFAFAKAYPDTVDQKFREHWETWFTQDDVNHLVDLGINTVRIPLGYWIVEPLVDRTTEFYPRGGILQLRRGLKQLKDAGIVAILDHHALPGVQSPNQMFTGRCTSDVQFYTPYNYGRALIWTAVMTVLTHLDPVFGNVVAIQAVNEPIMDANQTPGYGQFQKNFVQTVRAVEAAFGIPVPGFNPSMDMEINSGNFTTTLQNAANFPNLSAEVRTALIGSIPVLANIIISQLPPEDVLHFSPKNHRELIVTNFMDINWQHNNPSNPADAAIGPQNYDNHLYYSFGGVADPNEEAYLSSICNLKRIEDDAALGNSPLFFGEWALPTQFAASDEFLNKWADAQKLAYGKDAGWIFWNFKIEISDKADDLARQWSYFEGVRRGYLTEDPSQVHDPHVCDQYIQNP